jgi:hypothetical protein
MRDQALRAGAYRPDFLLRIKEPQMQRVNRSSAVPTLPAAPGGSTPGYFSGGNPGIGQPATTPGYEWFNAVQEELVGLILHSGLSLSGSDLVQLRKSLDRLYAGGRRYVTSNVTLTADDAGGIYVNATGAPVVVTLPAANAMNSRPIKFFIKKLDGGPNAVTVQCVGADTFEGAEASFVIPGGANGGVQIWSDGMSWWNILNDTPASATRSGIIRLATSAEADAGTRNDLAVTPAALGIATRNYANPGYARLPGGLILQWGETNSIDVPPGGGTVTATFPIAFPNACLNLQGTERNTGFSSHSITSSNFGLSSCSFFLAEWAAVTQAASVAYLAIGR